MPDAVDPVELVAAACAAHGLDSDDARLLQHNSNAVVMVPHERAIARVAIGRHDPQHVRRSQDVTRWLSVQHGFRTVVPLGDVDIVEFPSGVTVSFWTHYPQPDPPPAFTSADVGQLLRTLRKLPEAPVELPGWKALTSLEDALQDDASDILTAAERAWLIDRIATVREELAAYDWSLGTGLIHGDAWAGNLLSSPQGVALGDWDRVAHGPREVDLIPTWHAARRYGRGTAWVDQFIATYGYDLSRSPAFATLMTMRDLVQIPGPLRRAPYSAAHAQAFQQRFTDLRDGKTSTQWATL